MEGNKNEWVSVLINRFKELYAFEDKMESYDITIYYLIEQLEKINFDEEMIYYYESQRNKDGDWLLYYFNTQLIVKAILKENEFSTEFIRTNEIKNFQLKTIIEEKNINQLHLVVHTEKENLHFKSNDNTGINRIYQIYNWLLNK